MTFWAKILEVLDARMEEPPMYGWFHLLFFAASILLGIWLCRKYRQPDTRLVKKILLIISLVSIGLEIYKQINYSFSYQDGITYDFQWYAFPFQFCSTTMYVGLLAGLLPDGKLHRALTAYLATFSPFAGLCVMLYPEQVFITTIGINIQTMICHGLMISLGIFLLGSNYVCSEHKTVLSAMSVFAVLAAVAAMMNEIAYFSGLLERETFNMFYFSPHCDPSLPVFSLIQSLVPPFVSMIIYILAFTLAAYLILFISIGLHKVFRKKIPTEANEKETITV